MKDNIIIWVFILGGFLFSCNNNSSITSTKIKKDGLTQLKSDSTDLLFKHDIIEANKKVKISDTEAIRLIRQVSDLREIIDWKYKDDPTIINEAVINGIPSDTNPVWTIMISQFQPRIPISNRILTLFVNSNDGKISIWDIPNDTILTLDSWRKKEKMTK